MAIETTIEHPASGAVAMEIRARLARFNEAVGGWPPSGRALAVAARDGEALVGGLLGYTEWGWLFIDVLFMDEAARGRGIGRRLMEVAEGEARARGCHGAFTDTLDFQAPGFYRRLGYEEFGRLPGWGPHTRYWMRKSLA